jgi:hypothetical protein
VDIDLKHLGNSHPLIPTNRMPYRLHRVQQIFDAAIIVQKSTFFEKFSFVHISVGYI